MTHGVNTSGSEEAKKTLKHYHIVVVAYSMFIATVVYWINAEMEQLSDVRKAFRWHGFIHTVACGGHSLKKASPHAAVNSISKILLLRVIFLLFCPSGTMSNLLYYTILLHSHYSKCCLCVLTTIISSGMSGHTSFLGLLKHVHMVQWVL